jgi:alkaline phosphatase
MNVEVRNVFTSTFDIGRLIFDIKKHEKMNKLVFFLFLFLNTISHAQPASYTVANAHSHNDYEQPVPFYAAWNEGFGSIEADIFWHNNALLVAHHAHQLSVNRTLEDLYLKPLQACIEKNKGAVFADTSRRLQLMIDIKTDGVTTLQQLIVLLQKYPLLTGTPSLRIVISGNRPAPDAFINYPSYIWFDGVLGNEYSREALSRIAMLSDDIKKYTNWNGKGNIPAAAWKALQQAVVRSHALNKPVRFWGAPDFVNAWYQLMRLQVDYINTDHIAELGAFFKNLPANSQKGAAAYKIYQPTYRSDGVNKPVKNILLFIGDGTGLTQLYAGYTANKGALNIFNMRNIGLSKTSSYDNYVTDSAPGSTAISTGKKTNNRFVGVDHTGVALPLLPVYLQTKRIKTGLVTCGDISDATPADFYAHQSDRDSSASILRDLKRSSIDLLMGSGGESHANVALLDGPGHRSVNETITKELAPEYTVVSNIDSVTSGRQKKWVVIDAKAGLPVLKGRGDWLQKAFTKAVDLLSNNAAGFFLMTEGAQVDYGGHANNMSYVTTEVMDFDQVIGKALQFADANGETLVIVTADHETGGLTLLDGDYKQGYVSGRFTTNDHTAAPVPVFAYGPQAFRFRGVYENTELFYKILEVLQIRSKR